MAAVESDRVEAAIGIPESPRFGRFLALWSALVVLLNGVIWIGGFRAAVLSEAVERGAAHVEVRGIGELSDDLIRRAIQIQHETLPFWATLAWLGDFLVSPLILAGRAVAVATVFAAAAALVGRPVRYELALAECSAAQGIWVLGLAVQVALLVALRRADVETSLTLLLPSGRYPAPLWLALHQLDLFAVVGWGVLAWGGWHRGQLNAAAAVGLCGGMAGV